MNRDVSEANHGLHASGSTRREYLPAFQKTKSISAGLWYSKAPLGNEMHCQVDRSLTSALEIQRDRVLLRKILKVGRVAGILFANP